jgi:hypothetical protein
MLAATLLLLLVASESDPVAMRGWPLGLQSGCPAGDDAITVCGRRRDPERYRVKRDSHYEIDHPVEHGWGDLSRDMDDLSQSGLPGTSSAIGSGGQTGQRAGMMRDYKRWKDARARGKP